MAALPRMEKAPRVLRIPAGLGGAANERQMKGIGMKPQSVSMNADSGEKTWLTPPEIIKALGPFDTDPCCPDGGMPWPTARRMITKSEDGLRQPWVERVWLNPPYGRDAVPFFKRMSFYRFNEGGGLRSCSHESTPSCGTSGYSRSPMASSSFKAACASVAKTERRERRRPHRPRSSPTRRRIIGGLWPLKASRADAFGRSSLNWKNAAFKIREARRKREAAQQSLSGACWDNQEP